MKLENKVAAITGGSAGIGRAIAEAYLAEGAKVTIMARNAEKANAVLLLWRRPKHPCVPEHRAQRSAAHARRKPHRDLGNSRTESARVHRAGPDLRAGPDQLHGEDGPDTGRNGSAGG